MTYTNLTLMLGLKMDEVLIEQLRRRDEWSKKQRERQSSSKFKMRRAARKVESIKEACKKTYRGDLQGLSYSTGMVMEDERPPKRVKTSEVVCQHCQSHGHATRRSKKCKYYSEYKRDRGEDMDGSLIAYDPSLDEIVFENDVEDEELAMRGITVTKREPLPK